MFQFLNPRDAHMTTFTGRTEKHGDEWVPAVTIGFEIKGANTLLDLISPTLRTTLYAPVEGQEQLPGVELSTPILRCKDVTNVPLGQEYTGYVATIEHGVNTLIVLGDSTVKVKSVQVFDGGTVEISGSISSSDINEEEAGLLWAKQKSLISLALRAPEPKVDAAVIDGTVAAFNADHPDQGNLLADDATDAFIRSGLDDGLGMPPGTEDEAERQDRREEAVAASRKRMRNGGAVQAH